MILDFSHIPSFIFCPPYWPGTQLFQFLMVKVLFLPQGLELPLARHLLPSPPGASTILIL